VERLGICVRNGNTALRNAINKAQATLAADGTLAGLIKQWLGARRDAAGVNVKPLHVVRRDHRIVDILASPSSR
jgi:hypothetical protein